MLSSIVRHRLATSTSPKRLFHGSPASSTSTLNTAHSSDDSLLSVEELEKGLLDTQFGNISWSDFLLSTEISNGRLSIPFQRDARPWLKFLITVPLLSLTSTIFFSYYWLPILVEGGFFTFIEKTIFQWSYLTLLLLTIPTALGLIRDFATEVATCLVLLRGRRRCALPDHIPRLTHAVIICNYKEPLDVLRATVQSLADNTLAHSTIVVLACEDRDPTAKITFAALQREFSESFHSFISTYHRLEEGEIIGKSSNENFACRELHKYVENECLDPFQVMVTTCDADSLFDSVFLEQLENEYCRMPDGRRFLYNSPINTYRNLPECNGLVRAFEVLRCQFDTFNGITGFRPAQSNYSLTLGFAEEINFWDPSNTSEDFHTTLKAMAMTGQGETVVVKVWSLILNDSVTSFQDRWVQAAGRRY